MKRDLSRPEVYASAAAVTVYRCCAILHSGEAVLTVMRAVKAGPRGPQPKQKERQESANPN